MKRMFVWSKSGFVFVPFLHLLIYPNNHYIYWSDWQILFYILVCINFNIIFTMHNEKMLIGSKNPLDQQVCQRMYLESKLFLRTFRFVFRCSFSSDLCWPNIWNSSVIFPNSSFDSTRNPTIQVDTNEKNHYQWKKSAMKIKHSHRNYRTGRQSKKNRLKWVSFVASVWEEEEAV